MFRKSIWLAVLSFPLMIGLVTDASFATCYGNDPCNACKNCKYCKHCAKEGGTCGVCRRTFIAKAN